LSPDHIATTHESLKHPKVHETVATTVSPVPASAYATQSLLSEKSLATPKLTTNSNPQTLTSTGTRTTSEVSKGTFILI
jgi:hypothetical protein